MDRRVLEAQDIKIHSFENFDDAATHILHLMSQFIGINTLFIAKNDGATNHILKVYNQADELVTEGSSLPFEDTFCKLSVTHGMEPLTISNIADHELTRELNVTKDLGGGSFIGIPIYLNNGNNYGTICGLDKQPFEYSEEHLELFQVMASLITYVLELEFANDQIEELSSPLVPITEGVGVLPILGHITEGRTENMLQSVLAKSQKYDLDHLVIDLSGVLDIDQTVHSFLQKLVYLLNVVGIETILTGIGPELSKKAVEFNITFEGVKRKANLEGALADIGFVLQKK
ncbi:GAF domain-containing protein [Halobacillus amylolyticus]|uniref:GAF domain-containing protein n=1 Tax=Halobacillus amylolyticus TaxID=2932259 RepID=A0ABY4HFQ6_9BACI|nr:GAF domain-containing protein [Halobacillus amylolyticus]UOR13459.1 GAF domain-containing protein [Halobacillus amylolyticus]